MDYYLEKKIQLSEDSECQSIYPWSLQELNEKGEVDTAQVPWQGGLYFVMSRPNLPTSSQVN